VSSAVIELPMLADLMDEASCRLVPMPGALEGLRILDFSRVLAGPFATMVLGDFGAEVIKVERPGVGDETRAWGPPFDEHGEATYFMSVNRNKRSLALDLNDAADRARALELASQADVLVENFRPGIMQRLGMSYDELAARNPRLVYCSITGFGPGAGARLPGYDLLVQAVGGLMSITGAPDAEPQKVGVALVDVLTGLFAAVGVLAALRHREHTGRGQLVEVNLLASLLAALVNQGGAYTVAGVVPTRMGNAHQSIAPYELFATAAGELVIAVGNDRQFGALCEVLGAPALAHDPRFATNSDRVANREQLRAELVRLLAGRRADVWTEALTAARVPAGPVNDVRAAFEFAARLGLDPIVEVPENRSSADSGVRLTRNPISLSETPASYRLSPPRAPDAGGEEPWFSNGGGEGGR
jgi:crotonobetainyl-CoA:carnitine CoA-transferase CaiB-like acyl-CoA transferase